MKKKVLNLAFVAFAFVFIFSSCSNLWDNESKIEVGSDYVCVVADEYGRKYGFAGNVGYVSSSEFESRPEGTILIMGYKIIGNQTSNIPTLTEVSIDKDKIYVPSSQMNYLWSKAPSEIESEIYPKTLSTNKWSAYASFLDRWLFSSEFDIVDGTKIRATFYYNPDNQEEGNNRVILDVRFNIEGSEPSGTSAKKPLDFVANFDGIRYNIKNMGNYVPSTSSEGGTPVYLKIRYRKLDDTSATGYKEDVIGSFSSSGPQFIITE